MDPPGLKRRLTCILATDAVDYSRLVNTDETGALRILAAHRAVIDGIIAYHDGRIANTAGDSVLAEVDADAEQHALLLGQRLVARLQRVLDLDRGTHALDDAAELREHRVARGVGDAAVVVRDDPVDDCAVRGEDAQRAGLVRVDQAAVVDRVRG
ncbi:MAG: hypothetical protein ACHQJ7_09990, partial [Vicinamibacteria bacterium]